MKLQLGKRRWHIAAPKFGLLIASASGAAIATSATAGSTSFTDSTFPPANYSAAFVVLSDPSDSFAVSQCASCGNPGAGLQILVGLPTGGGAVFNAVNAIGLINSTFAYDPATQGVIKSVSASVDKDISINVTANYGNFFRPLIEQGGNFYVAPISGPVLIGPGTTGYNTLSQSGLTAADFVQVDPMTAASGTANADFAGGPMLFGLAQFTDADLVPGTIETVAYDNLNLTLTTVPEPADWALMLLGLGGMGVVARQSRQRRSVPA